MGERTGIEWTDATWNPWIGCTPVSAGCDHCYMARAAHRWGWDPGIVVRTSAKTFRAPLKWRARRIFTCSWSDFFHVDADAWRDDAWDVVRSTPQHRSLVLTKRPERVFGCLPPDWHAAGRFDHVWLGVTVKEQAQTHRIPEILCAGGHAGVFVSAEPLLGPLDLSGYERIISWLIVAGESGPGARTMESEWVVKASEWALGAHVPYFFKRWADDRDIPGVRARWERREVPEALSGLALPGAGRMN